MKRLIIFDLDGTLLNTIGGIGCACNEMLEHYGLPLHEIEEYNYFVGNGSLMLIKRALPEDKAADEAFLRQAKEYYLKCYRANLARETRPYDGMPELLQELSRRGVTMAVASNKFDDGAKFLVPHFFPDIKFAAVEGQKPGGRLKPDPDIISDAIGHSFPGGIERSEVLYVGDCEVDIDSATNSGLDYVLVDWGFRGRKGLEAAGAKCVIDTPAELLRFI